MNKLVVSVLILALLGYILFQARFLILGPRIFVTSPQNNEALSNPVVTVSGQVENAVSLSLDDRPIFPDQTGNFSEELLASPGLNIIKLDAKDRFGRETEQTLNVVLN
jgi:Glucodextranase, domain B